MEKKNISGKITIFDLARNVNNKLRSKTLDEVAKEYSMDGFYNILSNSPLCKPIFDYDLKTKEIKIPTFDITNDFGMINYNTTINKSIPESYYSTYILFWDALFGQTNFLNVYTNNLISRNYTEGKYLVVGKQIRGILDYLNYKIPAKIPYAYCDIKSISYNYEDYKHDIFESISEMSKTNNFDYYTTQTTSFDDFTKTMINDFTNTFSYLIISSEINFKENVSNVSNINYTVYDSNGLPKDDKIPIVKSLEFDSNPIIKENFTMPTILESYNKLIQCVEITGSCVIVSNKNDLSYFEKICNDVINKFTSIYCIRPILLPDYIVLVCRNRIPENMNILESKSNIQNYSKLIQTIIELFKDSEPFDIQNLSMIEIQKLTGCI